MGCFYRTFRGYRCPGWMKIVGASAIVATVITACATLGITEPPPPPDPEPTEIVRTVKPGTIATPDDSLAEEPLPDSRHDAAGLIESLEIEVALWPGFAPAAASLTFDDGTRDQYAVAAPVLERNNVRGTFYLISHKMDDGVWIDNGRPRRLMSWEEARELSAAGHEIGSHGATHIDLSRSRRNLRYELHASRRRIEERLPGVRVDTLAWPYWRSTPRARSLARSQYLAARGGAGTPAQFKRLSEDNPLSSSLPDRFNINSIGLRPQDPPEEWRQIGEEIVDDDGWVVFSLHGVRSPLISEEELGWAPIEEAQLDALIQELHERNLWIAPFREAAAYALHRDYAEITIRGIDSGQAEMSLTGFAGAEHLDVPLTLRVSHPGTERIAVREDAGPNEHASIGPSHPRAGAMGNNPTGSNPHPEARTVASPIDDIDGTGTGGTDGRMRGRHIRADKSAATNYLIVSMRPGRDVITISW